MDEEETETSRDDGQDKMAEKRDETLEHVMRERRDMEAEYGRQMSRAKGFILSLEGELKKEQQLRLSLEEEKRTLSERLDSVLMEAEGVRTAANLQQASSQEEISTRKRQYEEEIASLKHIMEVAASDSKRDVMAQLQAERNSWTQSKQQLESEIANLRGQINFVQQRNHPSYQPFGSTQRPVVGSGWQQGTGDPRWRVSPPTSEQQQQRAPKPRETTLEESMRWAQHNTEFMRSIVEPLEEEISILKMKLREVQEKLDASEAEVVSLQADNIASETDKLELRLPESEKEDGSIEADDKIRELEKYVQVEKSSRTDLEMYVAVLNTQKDVLQKETENLKEELRQVCRQLEEEKASHDSLKKTWQMANVQFLETQQLHQSEMKRIATILTPEQLEQLSDLKAVLEDIMESSLESLGESSLDSLGLQQSPPKQSGNRLPAVPLVDQRQPTISQSMVAPVGGTWEKESEQSAVTSLLSQLSIPGSDLSDRRAKSLPVETVTTGELIQLESPEPRRLVDSLLGIGENLLSLTSGTINTTSSLNDSWTAMPTASLAEADISGSFQKSQSTSDLLDDSEGLGDVQRSISADSIPKLGDTSPTRRKRSDGKMRHVLTVPLPPETSSTTITVAESEWLSLHEEVKDSQRKLEQQELMTLNYEDQLQKLQKDNAVLSKASREATTQLRHEMHKLRAQLQRQQQLQNQLECSTAGAAQELQARVTMHCDEHQALQLLVSDLQETFTSIQTESDAQLATLGQDKARLCAEVESNHSQIDGLHRDVESTRKDLERSLSTERQSKAVAETKLAAVETQVQQLRKHIKDTEEQLHSENMFLRDRVTSEQFAKNTMEESLQVELSTARNEITVLRHVKAELDKEKEQKEKLQNEVQQKDQSLRSIRGKSKETILVLQSELEGEHKARVKLEEESRQHRSQIDNLKSQLETSQSVQRDFVQLSQTLQMQLNQLQESRN